VIKRREIVLGGASLISCFGRFSYTSMARAASSDKFEVVKSDEEWRRELTGEQYAVLRRHDTERAWTSSLNKEYRRRELGATDINRRRACPTTKSFLTRNG
jgi:peptide-methionine (R)-S-oxide reductase